MLVAGILFYVVGCECCNPCKTQAKAPCATAYHPVACRVCYNRAVQARTACSRDGGTCPRVETWCPTCKCQMVTYSKNGKAMMVCPKCAPQGVECDRCASR